MLYATYRYGWDTTTVGLTLAIVGICAMVVQGGAIGPIVKRFGERRALLLGLGCGAVGFLDLRRGADGPLFWLGIPVMALWGVAGAGVQAMMTQTGGAGPAGPVAGRHHQRAERVAQLVGPFLFTLTFAYFIGDTAPLQAAGRAVLAGGGAAGAGACRSRCGRWRRGSSGRSAGAA